ncbi:MAG TPA: WhiB family transcriptional regulator [Acidimicrobiales bacterium]|nr:WhiB family transcriptional regulator [Acidimicrobiales bacterium]
MSAEVGLLALVERLRPEWQARGSCRGTSESFFPTRGEDLNQARRVCAGCQVRSECLDYALEHGIRHGVWGGTSEAERRRIRQARRAPGSTELAVARLAQRGVPPPEIAEQLGVTTRTVYRHLQRGAA